jgi:hypothetical protein
VIVLLVLALGLGLRLVGLDAFVVNDEMRWTCRSIGFQEALARGEWASTFRTGHPGVVTTWLGAIFIPHEAADADAREACQITPDASELSESGDTPAERTRLMHSIRDLLFKARRGVALFTWVSLIGIYLLTRHLWGVRVALLSLVLVAVDPFYLALSRILHVDGALTSTMTLSVLSLVAALRCREPGRRGRGFLVLSGVMAGLSILQKSPAMFLAAFAVLLVGIDLIREGLDRRRLLRAIQDLLIWGLVVVLVYVVLWPAMWVRPAQTIRQVLEMALGYAAEGHSSGNYFLGNPTEDPGWMFYPIAVPFRLSPVALIGLIAGGIWLARGTGRTEEHRAAVDLLIYGVTFGAFMTLGNKMFDRYLVPVFPSLAIVAAVGLWWGVDVVRDRLAGAGGGLYLVAPVVGLVVAVQLAITLPHYPHFLTYYNPVLGGIRQARKILLVGWGEGYEQAAAYLNDKPNAEKLQVIMPAFPVFAPQFDGSTRSMEQYSIWGSDYVMFYLSHVQRRRYEDLVLEYLENPQAEPERVFALHGVDYIWLYHNDHYLAPTQHLEDRGQPERGECVLVNGKSLFAKYYQGALPLLTFDSTYDADEKTYRFWSRAQMAELLDQAARSCQRIWYVGYPAQEQEDYAALLRKRCVELDRSAFPEVELSLHQLAEQGIDRQSLNLRFGNLLLRSRAQTSPPVAWGRDGGLVLEWEALQPLEEDYSTFLHVYNAHGHRIAQGDTLITDKYLEPTSRWEPGSRNSAVYHLAVPAETPAGEYELVLGVYLLRTGERLPLVAGDGEALGKSGTLSLEVGVPDQPPGVEDLPIAQLSSIDLVPQLRLIGYSLEHEEVLAGEGIPVRLFWEAKSAMDQVYRLQIGLRGDDGSIQAIQDYDLVTTDHPTTEWRRGETLGEWYYLSTERGLPTGEKAIEVNLLDEEGRPVLPQAEELAGVWVQSGVSSFEVPDTIGERLKVTLGDRISVLGYDVQPSAQPGRDLKVTITWQALQEMEADCKVFVHLYDADGGILGQRDRIPGLGARPTTTWATGEVLVDRFSVPVPHDTPPGKYRLAAGIYDPKTGQRLAATDSDGRPLEQNRVPLGEIEVTP